MKIIFGFLLACFVFISNVFADEVWQPVSGIKESDIKEIAIGGGIIYASSEKRLYRSEDSGETWKAVFTARGDSNAINFIGISEQDVFVCTDNGVFKSNDGASNWKKIFKGIGTGQNSTNHIAFNNNKIFLGTRAGLFISSDNGITWQKSSGETGSISIKWITFLDEAVFLATEKGVYKGSGSSWKRTFITSTEEIEYDANSADGATGATKPVNSILVAQDRIYLATDSGIFVSEDKGNTWSGFPSGGLLSQKVKRILFNGMDKVNLAATDDGVFIFSDSEKIWRALYKGMATDRTYSLSIDDRGVIWVASDKGLYRSTVKTLLAAQGSAATISDVAAPSYGAEQEKDILRLFAYEPNIREVQEVAIKYAEVHPDKIKHWREAASKKALLPDVSVGVDRYVTNYWHWDAGQNPDVLQKGDDVIKWDITMSWDLGDLIWSTDQTSIDTRSRLMVQLRDDILDEITRVYFERRRLQIENQLSPPTGLKQKLEKDLRIQELTADLDALTGGYFSSQHRH